MLNLQLARKYARAMFEIALQDGKLEEFDNEMANIRNDLASVAALKGYLANPQIQRQDKKKLIGQLFRGEISTIMLNFLYLLIDKRRIELFDAIDEIYRALANEARGIIVADVTGAKELTVKQKEAILQKLMSVTGKKVSLRLHEDESLIGGVVVRIGDKRIDGSVKGRLQRLRSELVAKL